MNCFINRRAPWVVASLVLFCPANGPAYQSRRSVSELVKSSVGFVVRIAASDENSKSIVDGSGLVVFSDGKIVINHHPIGTAHSATGKLEDGDSFSTEGVLADDPEHDVALIKIAAENLPFLTLAALDCLSVGDRVLLLRSQLGLGKSAADGSISGSSMGSHGITAAASRGKSGGPLLTLDGRLAGILTSKVAKHESLNRAVPSEPITPLLAKSILYPFGGRSQLDSSSSPRVPADSVWTSTTDGRDYKVRFVGEYMYAEWVNLPRTLKRSSAFSRSELKKSGDKWIGRTTTYMPFEYQHDVTKTIWCRVKGDIEIDKVSASRIQGRSQLPTSFNQKKCQPENLEWKPFTWIPK